MTVDLDQAGQLLAQLVVIGGGLAAGYWGLVRWLRRVAGASERAERQLRTSNGHTTGQLVEKTSHQLTELKDEMRVLTGWAGQNRDGWQRALSVAERAEAKIDAHLAAHHKEEGHGLRAGT